MELNEPIALGDELQFCETGNRLALEFLRISRDVLKDAVAAENENLSQVPNRKFI
jgi:hypothetical protein